MEISIWELGGFNAVKGQVFELVLRPNKMHLPCNVVSHLAVAVGRGHGDGTLAVKKERNHGRVIRVAMMDFIEKHAKVGSGHGSGVSSVVIRFGGGHGNWGGHKATLVNNATLAKDEEASGFAASIESLASLNW